MREHMKKHAQILRPKFETVISVLENELGGLGIGSWSKPKGGYFISFDAMEGCAKAIVAKAKEAGLIMTGAGATFPTARIPKTAISVSRRPSPHRKNWRWLRRSSC